MSASARKHQQNPKTTKNCTDLLFILLFTALIKRAKLNIKIVKKNIPAVAAEKACEDFGEEVVKFKSDVDLTKDCKNLMSDPRK